MPKEVADALKKQGHWKDDDGGKVRRRKGARNDRRRSAITRWCWRSALALIQAIVPLSARARSDATLMGVGRPDRAGAVRVRRAVVRGADGLLRRVRFLGRSTCSRIRIRRCRCSTSSPSVWGNHEGSMLLWVLILALFGALVALFGGNLPATLQGQCAGGAGLDRGGVLSLHPGHLEPVPAPRRRRRSRAATSIRSCRTSASRSIRRCSISAMSASRSRSRSRSRR